MRVMYLPENERELLLRIAEGDESAFRVFFDAYKNRFYAVVLKMTGSDATAEELVQEVFLKIWQSRHLLAEVDNSDAYFFTAVYRLVFRHYKKVAQERKLLQTLADADEADNITDETILAAESKRLIEEAVSRLPQQQQLVFRLTRNDGLSREQVAEQLQISPNTVRNHLADATRFIRDYLNRAALVYLLLCLWPADAKNIFSPGSTPHISTYLSAIEK
jgi:RNA polymerase sigma-70 factor (ECF subfamily)